MEIDGDIIARAMLEEDAKILDVLLQKIGSETVLYKSYLEETASQQCEYAVALCKGEIAGYAKLDWASEYEDFIEEGIPEIKDLWVREDFRNKGVASHLMTYLEVHAAKHSKSLAIGVGLSEIFEPLQDLLASRGYEPDGKGTYYMETEDVQDELEVDDNQALMMIKYL